MDGLSSYRIVFILISYVRNQQNIQMTYEMIYSKNQILMKTVKCM